jgi:NAD-dependent SIR2 family protein deacetylase
MWLGNDPADDSGRRLASHAMPPQSEATVFLLGAGASAEAGIPMSFEMTRQITEAIGVGRLHSREAAALNFVVAQLLALDAAEIGASPYEGLDVERVFAAVQLLAQRQSLEVTPFVASWLLAVDAVEGSPMLAQQFDSQFASTISSALGVGMGESAHNLLTRLIDSRMGRGNNGAMYKRLADLMLDELRRLVATTRREVHYLMPLVELVHRQGGLTIATLNYDLSIEFAATAAGIALTTGIREWIQTGGWEWPEDRIRLLKLHGSIDWAWQTETRQGQLPREFVSLVNDPTDLRPPAVIFGQGTKLRAEGPFLGLLAEFERLLARGRLLVVIGYSFRDDHVNEIIRRWTAEDEARTLLVVDPSWPDAPEQLLNEPNRFRSELAFNLIPCVRHGQPPPFEPRLRIWRDSCSAAVARLADELPSLAELDA